MVSPKLRKTSYRLHAFFGLHIFAIMALIFLSGSTLMFVWELEATYTKSIQLDHPASTNSATFGQRYDNILAYDPTLKPVYFTRTGALWMGESTLVRTSENQELYIWSHPETADILGASSSKSLRKFIRDLHTSAMTNRRIGTVLISGFSLILLFFIISGFIAYHQFWRGFFRVPSRTLGARLWWGGIHKLIALWLSPFLLIMALTGFYYFLASLGIASTRPPNAVSIEARADPIPTGFSGVDLERAVNVAKATMPDLDITRVELPVTPQSGIVVYGWTDAIVVSDRANMVIVDPVTFGILGQFPAEDLSTSRRLKELNQSLHTGVWGGLFSRVLWFILGLIATFFCFAGMMIYASKVAMGIDAKPASVLARIWHGMSVLKWGVAAFALAIGVLAVYRFAL